MAVLYFTASLIGRGKRKGARTQRSCARFEVAEFPIQLGRNLGERCKLLLAGAVVQVAEPLVGRGLAALDPKLFELLLAGADVGEREIALASFLANVADERVVLVGAVVQVAEPLVGLLFVLVGHFQPLFRVVDVNVLVLSHNSSKSKSGTILAYGYFSVKSNPTLFLALIQVKLLRL